MQARATQKYYINEDYEGEKHNNRANLEINRYWHSNACPFDMRRYLRSKVGSLWSTIYSDLCYRFKDPYDRYCLDHWWLWCIDILCFEENGNVYTMDGYSKSKVVEGLYVLNNIICYKEKVGRPRAKKGSSYKTHHFRALSTRARRHNLINKEDKFYGLDNKIWYELILETYNPTHTHRYDQFFKYYIWDTSKLESAYGRYGTTLKICKKKIQLNKRDIQRLQLNEIYQELTEIHRS